MAGSLVSSIWNRLCSPRQLPQTIMLVGLDNSGKTSLLEHLKTAPAPAGRSPQVQSEPGIESRRRRETSLLPMPAGSELAPTGDLDSLLGQPAALDEEAPLVGGGQSSEQDGARRSQSSRCASPVGGSGAGAGQRDEVSPTIGYNYKRLQLAGQPVNVLDFSGQNRYRGLWQEFFNCADAIVFVIDSSDLIRLVVARDELENLLSHPFFGSLQPQQPQPQQQQQQRAPTGAAEASASESGAPLAFETAQKQLIISQGKLIQTPLEGADSALNNSHSSGGGGGGGGGGGAKSNNKTAASRQRLPCAGRKQGGRRTRVPILLLANKTDLSGAADGQLVAKALNLHQLLPVDRHPWHLQATSVATGQGIREAFEWLLSELSQ